MQGEMSGKQSDIRVYSDWGFGVGIEILGVGNGYYPPVEWDRERRRGPSSRPGDSNIKRAG